ncbi:hypothetical protein Tco_0748695 [Tanacetum coccineum]|uniref:Uncharacterized protein n=1 Tax=Tanacetum coccineum TaxID=301880 RepID=A0ABQ4YWD9_9ASTR
MQSVNDVAGEVKEIVSTTWEEDIDGEEEFKELGYDSDEDLDDELILSDHNDFWVQCLNCPPEKLVNKGSSRSGGISVGAQLVTLATLALNSTMRKEGGPQRPILTQHDKVNDESHA